MSPNGNHKHDSETEEKQHGVSISGLIAWLAFLATVIIVVQIIWG